MSKSTKDTSKETTKPDPLTHHGRPLGDTGLPKQPALKRSNSVRRMDRLVLQQIATTSAVKEEASLAKRELQVRLEMQEISKRQVLTKEIAATKPISPKGIDALRYSQSLAEESYDEANAVSTAKTNFPAFGKKTTPLVIGASENNGRIGVGFSGDKDAYPKGGMLLAKGMLDLQKRYTDDGKTKHWSGRLIPVPFPSTITSPGTICAATRSTAATIFPDLGKEQGEIPRERFAKRESLVEAQSESFTTSKTPKYVHQTAKGFLSGMEPEEPPPRVLKRSQSLQNLMDSCGVCKKEFEDLSKKRSETGDQ